MKTYNLLELLETIDKEIADFCKKFNISEEDEIEEIWKMFRKEKITN